MHLSMHIQESVIAITLLWGHIIGMIQYSSVSISDQRTQQDKDDNHIRPPLYKTLSNNPE
jgi:hypothetical protein